MVKIGQLLLKELNVNLTLLYIILYINISVGVMDWIKILKQ